MLEDDAFVCYAKSLNHARIARGFDPLTHAEIARTTTLYPPAMSRRVINDPVPLSTAIEVAVPDRPGEYILVKSGQWRAAAVATPPRRTI
ncbi:MAG TPA: hypothetical protein VN837_04240 [Chloroflexota bacterium]|nr:hypothetical protein [Chloroflexota bacterium]